MEESPKFQSKEFLTPRSIVVATTTFYPGWRLSPEKRSTDKIRGDLFIELAKEAISRGYQLSIVDGGSSEEFIKRIEEMGIRVHSQEERGMSASRRQAFREASNLSEAKVICWTEPEKVSIVRDCLPEAIRPILEGKAEIVVPKRDEKAFNTYPKYQARYEKRANLLWNKILKSRGLLSVDQELDIWFGPKFFINKDEILDIFLRKFEYKKSGSQLDEKVNPEQWANATFLPVVAALHKGYKVLSVEVPYRHPSMQTENEADSEEFREKRELQLKNIIVSTIHYIRFSENDPKSKLKEAE